MPLHAKRIIPPGNRIRALVVDDSVVIRRLVTHALSEDPVVEVVGSASNGNTALARVAQLNPDVMVLDIEMPEMDGLEVLRAIQNSPAKPKVVVFSSASERGAAVTYEALALGADDYVTKSANAGSLDLAMSDLKAEILPKVKQFFEFSSGIQPDLPAAAPRVAHPVDFPSPATRTPKVVAIGVSTGGPEALSCLLAGVPSTFPLPIVIVQHMPPRFTKLLAERLTCSTALAVDEAVEGAAVVPGTVLIAPGNYHMRLKQDSGVIRIALDQSAPENSCRPAVDVLFRSVAEVCGADAISIILTGMGQDGLHGAQNLKARGAYVIAQDEATSVVWGMPGAVVSAGLADAVLPLQDIFPEVVKQLGRSDRHGR